MAASDLSDQPSLSSISPFYIVTRLDAAVRFYRDTLGFEVTHLAPEPDPYFAIVQRDGAMIFLKMIGEGIGPVPNHRRHPWARWDAYVHAPDPDALAAEFASRHATFHEPLADTSDGLRGFEIVDADGYVLFFGRPR